MQSPALDPHRPVPPVFMDAPDAAACRARVGMLQALIDGLFDAACLIDADSLTVLGLNAVAEQQLGRPASTLVGQPVSFLASSPEDLHFWLAVGDAQRMGLGPADARLRLHSDTLLHRADGELAHVERRIVPIELPTGHAGWLLTWHDDTPRHRAQQEVDRLAAELGATLEGSRDAVLVTDIDGAVRGGNQVFMALLGCPVDTAANDAGLTDKLRSLLADPLQWSVHWQALQADPRLTRTALVQLHDGRSVEWHSVPQYARGEPVGRVHVLRDVTEQLADEARARIAAELFDNAADAIFVLDGDLRIVAVNRTGTALFGGAAHALQGRALSELLRHEDPTVGHHAMHQLGGSGRWEGRVDLLTPGEAVPVQATVAALSNPAQATSRYIVTLRDLREAQQQQRALQELTHCDTLTRLPNRQRLAEHARLAIDVHTAGGTGFALLAVAVDRFSHINDSLGHGAGDTVLMEVASRLAACVRDEDMVARLGGDTFVILVNQATAADASHVADRVMLALNGAMNVAGVALNLTASVGAALFPADGTTLDELVRNADIAMHHAKRGAGLHFYEPSMHTELLAQVRLDHAMREALRERRFALHYQPQVDLATGCLVGVEALLRWHDPVLGNVSPAQFIPVAEQSGFIVELGDHVLEMAVERAASWHRHGSRVPVAVNISALQFQRTDFVDRVLVLLAEHALPGDMLELELTEGVLLGHGDEMVRRVQQLAGHGVGMSIDDFGTGYSSLGYLKRLPINRLKIDRSFVKDLPADVSDAAIVRSIVELGRAMDLRIVAEGVETPEQRDFLLQAGCHEAQGFLYAPALPPAQLERRFNLLRRPASAGVRHRAA